MMVGIVLYIARSLITPAMMKFILPTPPVAVGAYVFIFKLFSDYDVCYEWAKGCCSHELGSITGYSSSGARRGIYMHCREYSLLVWMWRDHPHRLWVVTTVKAIGDCRNR